MSKLGLTSQEAKDKLSQIGPNVVVRYKSVSPVSIFLSQFPNFINGILLLAGFLAFIIGENVDGLFILVIVLLNGIFGFIQEFRAEKAAEALKNFVVAKVRVIRDGKEQEIPAHDLVPGDLIKLNEGDKIPADGSLIDNVRIEVDESILTGESLPVLKTNSTELFMGTTITRGHCKMLINSTGQNTKFGEIAKTLSQMKEEETPLHKQINRLGKQLAAVTIILGISILSIGFFQGRDFFSILFTAVSISVAAIPEGLPAVITIALALGMQRMAKKRAVVRKLSAIETLGATQIIFTDKTGTLTQNEMKVKKVWYEGPDESFKYLLRACVLGNTASLIEKLKDSKKDWDIVGDKTDGALLLFAKENREDLDTFIKEGEVIDEYVFDPLTKTVTTVWKYDHRDAVFVRGAPERILEVSKFAMLNKKKVPLTDMASLMIKEKFDEYAGEGLRIIGFGYRDVIDGKKLSRKELEQDLIFLGFVGIYDPPRAQAKQAVELARGAGIKTIMVTGDNEVTALSVAKEVGLIEDDENVVLGTDLNRLSDEEVLAILQKTRVFARTTPMDKLRLVELCKKSGLIVAVTGDGVNDALALKKADVGVAMGKTGTDVAKEASDIIVTDDNFASLVSAIEEGRTIYGNIVKAITFLLSANLSEVAIIFFAVLFGLPSPLLPTQILWINLITDGLPALALASDVKDSHVLRNPPRDPKQHILSWPVVLVIVIGAFVMTTITLAVFVTSLGFKGIEFSRAVVFNLIIGLQLLFIFVIRGKKHPLSNRFLLITIMITILIQTIIMLSSGLRGIFHIII